MLAMPHAQNHADKARQHTLPSDTPVMCYLPTCLAALYVACRPGKPAMQVQNHTLFIGLRLACRISSMTSSRVIRPVTVPERSVASSMWW